MSERASKFPRLIGIVLTLNEEANLAACLESIHQVVDGLVIVDSGSTDRTLEIAQAHAARILNHAFESHAKQWLWALAQLPREADWVLALDADQHLSLELKSELVRWFTSERSRLEGLDGLYVKRRQIFRGQWIRHGGYYPKFLLKIFRVSRVRLDERDLMDHHFYVQGRSRKLEGDLVEDNRKEADISFWLQKHIRYAELHAREELIRGTTGRSWVISPDVMGSPDQRVIWFKQHWFRLPLFVRPFVYFFYRYFIRRGFLDGKQGFIFHFLQSFWYRLLIDIHLDELRRGQTSGTVRGRSNGALGSTRNQASKDLEASVPAGQEPQ